jgi:hypothetical protein
MSSRTHAIDVDAIAAPTTYARRIIHSSETNSPCNCGDCTTYAVIFGAAYVIEDGDKWIPLVNSSRQVRSISPRTLIADFHGACKGDVHTFASYMMQLKMRAYRRDVSNDPSVDFYPNLTIRKRKMIYVPTTETRTPANTTTPAKSIMPRPEIDITSDHSEKDADMSDDESENLASK